ncbi:hypothetical protein C8R48DRAFT_667719 [Suillus tomentosus]|nr:hypothetical protein C8R48DRAFT_667719 [Suillus tomentosus]
MWNLWNVWQAQAGSEIQPSCCTCRMPAQHPQVRHSEQIKAHIKTNNTSHMAVPRPPRTNRGKPLLINNTTDSTAAPATTSTTPAAKFSVRWETCELDRTDALVQFLDTYPADCCVLFNEPKKSHDPAISEPDPSGSQKNHIWAVIAEVIFEKDVEYKNAYAEDKHKFTTSAGINPLDAASAQNLREQVLINFPWFDILDKLWKSNLVFAPKMISSMLGVDHTANMAALTQGKGLQIVAQAPSPDPYNIIGDAESDVIDDILDEPLLAQERGKEKALPPSCSNESMDEDLNPNDGHTFIPQPEPPLPSTSLNDADDVELQDDNFGPSN